MKDMRRAKDERGLKLFQPVEYLSEQQIANFFSREVSRRRKATNEHDESDDECLLIAEEETLLDTLHSQVRHTLGLQHPIVFDTFNVCQLVTSKTLSKLTLSQLKDMCSFFDINTAEVKTQCRKRPFVEKLEALIKDCSCQMMPEQ